MKVLCLLLLVGLVCANDWSTLRDRCDTNGDKDLDSTEFTCLFMQFDTNYDDQVDEKEFESGWKHFGLDNTVRTPVFFLETDVVKGDYLITSADMTYLMVLWDANGNGEVDEHELQAGWNAFYNHRFHSSD